MPTDTQTGPQEHGETEAPFPFYADLTNLFIKPENPAYFQSLLKTARRDFAPRDFGERHFVDEMAFLKWRMLRLYLMEKALFDNRILSFRTRAITASDGTRAEPFEDFHHFALALSPDVDGPVINAIRRLETSLHRQFCSALRMLMAMRRFNPFRNPELADRSQCKCGARRESRPEPISKPKSNSRKDQSK
jgi:hypothetical protein